MKSQILALVGLICGTIIGLPSLSAQVLDANDVEAQIPFKFTVENTALNPGQYTIRQLSEDEMIIQSNDGQVSVAFVVEAAEARRRPTRTELVFRKYGDRDFLGEIFVEGNRDGLEVVPSRTEKKLEKSGAKKTVHRHPAHTRKK